jgi:hypothetical protein
MGKSRALSALYEANARNLASPGDCYGTKKENKSQKQNNKSRALSALYEANARSLASPGDCYATVMYA